LPFLISNSLNVWLLYL